MITIKNHNFRTQLHEMTVKEFGEVTAIFNDETLMNIEKYLDAISVLGISDEVINALTNDELFEIIQDFNVDAKIFDSTTQLPRTITVEGITYEAFPEDGEFQIKARELALIEKAIQNRKTFFQKLLAIVFKNPELNKEHFVEAHLRHKESLFSELNAKEYVLYLVVVSEKLSNKVVNAINSAAKAS